jgi:hypothetical protein
LLVQIRWPGWGGCGEPAARYTIRSRRQQQAQLTDMSQYAFNNHAMHSKPKKALNGAAATTLGWLCQVHA